MNSSISELNNLIEKLAEDSSISDIVFRLDAKKETWELCCLKNRIPQPVAISDETARSWQSVEAVFPKIKRVSADHCVEDYATFGSNPVRRFRLSATTNSRGIDVVVRLLPPNILDCKAARIPESLVSLFCELDEGLVLICGPTGHGKSTTMASLVMERCKRHPQKVDTIEDPVEYVYPPMNGSLFQYRQVGEHIPSFAEGLKQAMRQSPGIIVVGEIRDQEAAMTAVSAGLSGHVVIASLHAFSCAQAIQRLFSFVNQGGQNSSSDFASLGLIASSLKIVSAQKLLVSPAKNQRVPIHQVMSVTSGVEAKIRGGDFQSLCQDIECGRIHGMQTFDKSRELRVREGFHWAAK